MSARFGTQSRVLLHIHANPKSTARSVSKSLGLDTSATHRACAALVACGAISKHKTSGQTPATFTFNENGFGLLISEVATAHHNA